MIWLSLLLPLIGAGFMLWKYRERLTWWEVLVPMGVSLLFTVIFKWSVEKIQVSDTEYWGDLGVKAQYYESYETWKKRTCSKQVPCGTDGKGHTKYCTVYYDCSYCDYTSPKWYLINTSGESFAITEKYFQELSRRWKSTPSFRELNRSITYHLGCGKDGDMYEISWNKDPLTSEPTFTSHYYENRVKAAHTAFDFPDISEEEKKKYELFEYPEIQGYDQHCALGLEKIQWMSDEERNKTLKYAEFLSGKLGPKKEMKLWVLFFQDKEPIAANMQEALWSGGNMNEMVICIGLSSHTNVIQWVRPFSWTKKRRLLVDLREDIMEIGKFNSEKLYSVLEKDLQNFKRKDFKEFNYVTVDPPTWAIWVTFIVTGIATALLCYWAVVNDIEADHHKPWKSIRVWRN